MKNKTIAVLTALILAIQVFAALTISAAGTATLTGPSTVRAGDTITLTFNVNGGNTEGVSGTLSYDSSQLTLSGTKQQIASPWAVEFSGNNMVAYDNDLSKPIKSNTKLFTVTFKVKSGLSEGTKITVSFTDVRLSDGTNETNAGTVSYSVNIAAPLSGNCNLKSLTVSNATISPSFSSSTTSYTASVPYEVSKLNVSATAEDSAAKVTVDSPTLKVNGTTNVTITVKAATGATKTYTIAVTRAQDPNYVPSGDNSLSGITVKDLFISPKFSENTTQYVVWLPYEISSISVTATTKDRGASYRVEGGQNLKPGQDNEVKVICVAENGDEKVYTIIAKRAADPNAEDTTDKPPEPSSDAGTNEPPTTGDGTDPVNTDSPITDKNVPDTDVPGTEPGGEDDNVRSNPLNIIIPIISGVVCLIIGFTFGKATGKK